MAMLITTSSFCQNTYPKAIVWNEDTIVAITPTQLQQINITITNYETLQQTCQKLTDIITVSDSISRSQENIIANHKAIIEKQEKSYQELHSSYQYYIDEAIKKEKRSRLITIGVGVGGTLIGTALGVLLSK